MSKLNFLARLLHRRASTSQSNSIASDWAPVYQAYFEKGLEALGQQRAADAVEAFGKAALLCPNDPVVQFNLGRALQGAGKIEAARLAYLCALELSPNASEIHSALLSLPPLPPERENFKPGQILHPQNEPSGFCVLEVRKGGFGAVYVVEDVETKQRWAFKTFQSRYLWSDEHRERFMREVLTWIKLDRHPNIVHARSVATIEGFPCLWLEYVPLSFADALRRLGPTPAERAAEFALQLCDGMLYANEKLGIVHRDLKPSNCLIGDDFTLKITDFGLAKVFGQIREESLDIGGLSDKVRMQLTGVAGTPHYMAPEQFQPGASLDTRSDIFAFGILFYEMLTHDLPPVGRAQSYIAKRARQYELPRDFVRIILQCVETEKERRPNNFRELRSFIESAYERLTGKAAFPPTSPIKMASADWGNKGIALRALGDYEGAIACFERAVFMNDHDPLLWSNYSAGLIKMGRLAEAVDCLDRGLQLTPDDPFLWSNKALILEALNQPEAARSCHERALELRPLESKLWSNLGAFWSKAGDLEDAIKCYEHALKINPHDDYALEGLAVALFRSGFYEEALRSCDEGLAIQPRNHFLWNTRACALIDMGRFQDALLARDRGLEIEPNHAKLWDNKGVVLRELGKNEEAEECFKRARDLST